MAEQSLDDLADAVLAGSEVDWVAVESSAGALEQPLVRDLKLMASVARLHREILPAVAPEIRGQWGHLRLLERVGRGACGEVFRAWDTRLDREVALKLLPAAVSERNDSAASALAGPLGESRSIVHEGRLLAKVRHPNVVTIHGAEQIGDYTGLWMEFIHGRTLEELLQQGVAFPPAEVIAIGVEVCRAVSAVHAAGLLHRDIKTHNVMRAADGRVVLMDFDVGREFDNASPPDVAGTPLYLAPEQFQGRPATVQSDVYGVGVLLYRLATGSYPVHGRSVAELRVAHERGERAVMRQAQRRVGSGLARVIDQAIDPVPERRHQSAAALGERLVELQRRERRKPVLYAGALVMTLASAGVLSWAWRAPAELVVRPGPAAPAQTTAASDRSGPGRASPGEPVAAPTAPSPPVGSPTPPPALISPAAGDLPAVVMLPAVARGKQIGVRPSVQVLAFANASGRSDDAWLSAALAEMILREFRGSERFRWIPGAVPMAKAHLGQALITESSTVVRPVVPADVIVSGEFKTAPDSDRLHLVLKLEDVAAGRTVVTVEQAGTLADLGGLITRAGAKARAALGAPSLTPDEARLLAASQPNNAAAARAYAEGLTKVARDWVESMEAAVAADPEFAPAHVALAEGWAFRQEPAKVQAAFARALEHSVNIPFEERKLIEIRALVSTGVPSTGPPDAATAARQNARVEAREAIFRTLYERYPDTLLYGFEVARAQLRTKQFDAGLATVDAISRLPGASINLSLAQTEGRLAVAVRNFTRAHEAFERVASIAVSVGDRSALAFVRNEQALLAINMNERVKALAFAEEALRHFAATRSRSQTFMVGATIAGVLRQGEFAWARQTYDELIASARQQGDRSAEGWLQHSLGVLLADHGDLSEARTTWERVMQGWTAGDRPDGVAPLLGLGHVLLRQGDFAGAEKTSLDAVAEAEVRQDVYQQSLAHYALSNVLYEQGDLLEARLRAERAVEAARAQGFTPRENLAWALNARARVLVDQSDAEAANVLQESLAITGASTPIGRADRAGFELRLLRARLALDERRPAEARTLAEEAVALARKSWRPDDEAAATAVLARAWLAEGRFAEAQEAASRVEQRRVATEDRLLHLMGGIEVARVRASVAATPTSATVARQSLDVLSRQAAALGAIALSFEARLALGEIEMRAGDVVSGQQRLAALERDAAARGFLRIARQAAAARR